MNIKYRTHLLPSENINISMCGIYMNYYTIFSKQQKCPVFFVNSNLNLKIIL